MKTATNETAADGSKPAFPVVGAIGMTLRDYFAAKAMSGMWASDQPGWECTGKDDALDSRAQTAYRQADAMLRARKA